MHFPGEFDKCHTITAPQPLSYAPQHFAQAQKQVKLIDSKAVPLNQMQSCF